MTARPTPRLHAYGAIVAVLLLGGLVLGRPELAALAAPFALAGVLGLGGAAPEVRARLEIAGSDRAGDPARAAVGERDAERPRFGDPARVLVGETIVVRVSVESDSAVPELDLRLALPAGLAPAGEHRAGAVIALAPGEARTVEIPVRVVKWGAHRIPGVALRARDRLALVERRRPVDDELVVRAYPRPEAMRSLLAPRRTQALTGSRVASVRGEGIEFADLRAWVPGDRIRRVNWRATARRDDVFVNDQHPERNTDVILFLDTFADVGDGSGHSSLDLALAAATSLARLHLARRDRVGLIGFGGVLSWLQPGLGVRQLHQIADALIESEVVFSYAWRDLRSLPPRLLPAGALVVAISPLLDPRARAVLLDLRSRGFDVAVVELDVDALLPAPTDELGRVVRRLWRLEREAARAAYPRAGIAVATWNPDEPFEAKLVELGAARRRPTAAAAG
jgi:uncharacterized protein (DUF58 family)